MAALHLLVFMVALSYLGPHLVFTAADDALISKIALPGTEKQAVSRTCERVEKNCPLNSLRALSRPESLIFPALRGGARGDFAKGGQQGDQEQPMTAFERK
eukprot:1623599-Rhodomonas_salina.3